MTYALRTTLEEPYAATISQVREALGAQGFGVLTEIDLQATMEAKLDADIAPQVILRACRPARLCGAAGRGEHRAAPALQRRRPLPRREQHAGRGRRPQMMVALTEDAALQAVSDDATTRLRAALASLGGSPVEAA